MNKKTVNLFILLIIMVNGLTGVWYNMVGNFQAATSYLLFAILIVLLIGDDLHK